LRAAALAYFAAFAPACGGGSARTPTPAPTTLPTEVSIPFDMNSIQNVGDEAYLCFSAKMGVLADNPLSRVEWEVPTGPVKIHHVSMYAVPDETPEGQVDCESISSGPRFSIFTPGSTNIELPADTALVFPPATKRLAAEVHGLRVAEGKAATGHVTLLPPSTPPAHLASWLESGAYVPPIQPRSDATGSTSCVFVDTVHVEFVWAHMHKAGRAYHSSLVRTSGEKTPLVNIEAWDVGHQPLYPMSFDAVQGDRVDYQCDWRNETDKVIVSGLYSYDEMCSFDMIAWPSEAAQCKH
jgi:hypothetical protein